MEHLNQVYILIGLAGIVISIVVGFFISKFRDRLRVNHIKRKSEHLLKQAEKEAAVLLREQILENKKKFQEEREEINEEIISAEERINNTEKRITQKEKIIEINLKILNEKQEVATKNKQSLTEKQKTLEKTKQDITQKLEHLSGLSATEAKKIIVHQKESKARMENQMWLKHQEEILKRNSNMRAREVLGSVLQRWTAPHNVERFQPIKLKKPSLKGKIVGKEGRNINEFESLTQTEVTIDEKENIVNIKSNDPVKREIARQSMEKIIEDGRIYPERIRKTVKYCQKKMEDTIRDEGEKAAKAIGLDEFTDEQLKILGRLKYRTSYGQNILNHSVETAQIASMIAAEINADREISKKAGLLHDIGKSVDHAIEGGHSVIGIEIARMFNQSQAVIHAIAGHHEDERPETTEAFLVLVADAISASRQGARSESTDNYIDRIKHLENLASMEKGIEKSYAIQAGRELRVYVHNDEMSDRDTAGLGKRLKEKIEKELDYPGEIKITVVRETQAIEYAR